MQVFGTLAALVRAMTISVTSVNLPILMQAGASMQQPGASLSADHGMLANLCLPADVYYVLHT